LSVLFHLSLRGTFSAEAILFSSPSHLL